MKKVLIGELIGGRKRIIFVTRTIKNHFAKILSLSRDIAIYLINRATCSMNYFHKSVKLIRDTLENVIRNKSIEFSDQIFKLLW